MEFKLRPWQDTLADAEAKSAFTNDPDVLKMLWDGVPIPYTVSDAQSWLKRVCAMPIGQGREYAIEAEGRPIGTIGYTRGESMRRLTAEIGYFLSKEYWGRGIVTDALKQVVDEIERTTDIVRVFAEVYSFNAASGRVLEKAGFRLESIQEKGVVKNGQLVDLRIYVKIIDR